MLSFIVAVLGVFAAPAISRTDAELALVWTPILVSNVATQQDAGSGTPEMWYFDFFSLETPFNLDYFAEWNSGSGSYEEGIDGNDYNGNLKVWAAAALDDV